MTGAADGRWDEVGENHNCRSYFTCEDGSDCVDDCFAGEVCDECTDAQDRPVWWPCPTVLAAGLAAGEPGAGT